MCERKIGKKTRDEARGADCGREEEEKEEEEEDVGESDGANDSLMKAEAARQKASLVFRSARVLLRHRSHPLCVYTCYTGCPRPIVSSSNGGRAARRVLPSAEKITADRVVE